MSDFIARQAQRLQDLIAEYRGGRIDLNALIQKIEGIGEAVGDETWKTPVFPIIVELEQINAGCIVGARRLTSDEHELVEQSLRRLEAVVKRFVESA